MSTSSSDNNLLEDLLLPHHLKSLREGSGISDEVILARGYRSINEPEVLEKVGFAPVQQITPTLVMPCWPIARGPKLYIHRPDEPRYNDKQKPIKYEIPVGADVIVDVHPSINERVRDAEILEPLIITEGTKKADAAISKWLCCIALIGVWNWRTSTGALPDWEFIPFKNKKKKPRDVYICFDSDVMEKESVHAAMARLGMLLKNRGAKVHYIYLPGGPNGEKVGLDDYFIGGGDVKELFTFAADELRPIKTGPVDTSALIRRLGGRNAVSVEPVARDAEWMDPLPLTEGKMPEFPADMLPDVFAQHCLTIAAATQTPPDISIMFGLAVVGSIACRRCRIEVPPSTRKWQETLNLYVLGAMDSGNGKSRVINALTRPLDDIEVRRRHDWEADIEAKRAFYESEELRLKSLKTVPKDEKPVARSMRLSQLEELANRLPSLEPPAKPRMTVKDITTEQLADVIAQQEDGCIALLNAEGGIFSVIKGQYSQAKTLPNMDIYLQGWEASAYVVDRASRSRLIQAPMLSMALLVQPSVLRSLAEDDRLRENGFLARFLYTMPEQLTGQCELIIDPPSLDASGWAYDRAVKAIYDLPPAHTKEEPGKRWVIEMDAEAAEVNRQLYNEIERRRGPDGDLSAMAAWASKLRGNVVRIAGILHTLDTASHGVYPWEYKVGGDSMAKAWTIGGYLIDHALCAVDEMRSDTTQSVAKRILGWICRTFDGKTDPSFTLRDCWSAHRHNSNDEIRQGLVRLQEHGYVRLQHPPTRLPGQRGPAKGTDYGIHPCLLRK